LHLLFSLRLRDANKVKVVASSLRHPWERTEMVKGTPLTFCSCQLTINTST